MAFVFRSLNIETVVESRVKIVVMQMSSEDGEARCRGEVISAVVMVGEGEDEGEDNRMGKLCKSSIDIVNSCGRDVLTWVDSA